jgi:arabinan endo-1,5-alpha-L-arabinosidase
LIWLLAASAHGTDASFEPLPLSGETFIHDPSTLIEENGRYYIFGTGPGIRSKSSPDLIHWSNGPSVFDRPPAWTKRAVDGFDGYFWAPDIIRVKEKYFLYYSVSTWGKKTSAIGLATSLTLDSAVSDYHWTDAGEVIRSTRDSAFNTIDPSVMQETNGKLWLAFGSYWEGIFLTELNPQTGQRSATNSPLFHLAWNHSIEAACLAQHGKFYYLFVNWGECCQGTNSTYEVRVGRAEQITGPYLDRAGKNLAEGGGSPFLQSQGRFIGPGHIGVLPAGGTDWFSYHYYDAATKGRSRLAIGRLTWPDDWPVAVSDAHPPVWQLVWHDEFNTNGTPDPANWDYERGFVRNQELQWYQPENAVCTDGLLVIEARPEHRRNPGFVPDSSAWAARREWIDYTSASLTTRGRHEFKYGRFEMRARIDPRSGSWPAFWTLGADIARTRWPACGEIDIMEFYTGTLLANLGYQLDHQIKWQTVKQPIAGFGGEAWAKEFHIWTMEWDEKQIDLRLDGQLMNHLDLATADNADLGNPFHRPLYLIINQAIGANGGDPSATQFPIRFEIDWVRVYQRDH